MNDNSEETTGPSTPDPALDGSDSSGRNDDPIPEIFSRDQHIVSRKNIDPDALKIMYRLNRFGYKAYLVGGGVRDLLLGKIPKDFDVATDATPRKIKSLFRNCRIIGRRFKLAHIYFRNNKIIEVSTFRDTNAPIDPLDAKETEELLITRDNVYGTGSTDAFRRDLSINALFYDLSSFSIIDYVGGMADLQNKIIRVIGDPDVRYAEDPVRLLRTVRHAARSYFSIEDSCRESILRNHELMRSASQVRLYEELKKDLTSGYAFEILRLLEDTTLLKHLIPEISRNSEAFLRSGAAFSNTLNRIDQAALQGNSPSVTSILCALALCLKHPELEESSLEQQFDSRTELDDYLDGCYSTLSVPRKERERISDTCSLWWRVMTTQLDNLSTRSLERRKCLEDLFDLMKWLKAPDEYLQVLRECVAAKKKGRNHPHHRKRNKRGKRGDKNRGSRRDSKKSGR